MAPANVCGSGKPPETREAVANGRPSRKNSVSSGSSCPPIGNAGHELLHQLVQSGGHLPRQGSQAVLARSAADGQGERLSAVVLSTPLRATGGLKCEPQVFLVLNHGYAGTHRSTLPHQ